MPSSIRLKLLVAAIGMATASAATAATTQSLRAQNLGAVPVNTLATHLGLGQDMSLVTRSSVDTIHGTKVVRQQQMYRGVPVYGRSVAVEQDAGGNALRATGEVLQNAQMDIPSVIPKLTAAKAVAFLKGHEQHTLLPRGASFNNEQANLFVLPQDGGPARLVYLTSYFVDDAANPTRPTAMVDANTGEVIQRWDGLTYASATGPGGNQKTGLYNYGTQYAALNVTQSGSTCTMQNVDVTTYNLNHATSGGSIYSFTCPNSNADAINGAYSPLNDAHHFGAVVHDMYVAYTGAQPLTFPLVMKVHYGNNYENAFWNGTVMTFGDGATTFYPLVSLDVTSHEISHGYTEQNSALQYTGMAGGINEAFSDIAGEAAEFYDRGVADFLVGRDIVKTSAGIGDALRYMCNPPADGKSIDNAANFTSSMDVHYSSGVYNKAFCLLAKTTGWDVKKAFQVFARANKSYWTATSTFNAGACGVESAATDLGYVKADVTAAFNGVGVACAGAPPPPPPTGSLQNGVAVTGLSGAANQELAYTVAIPAGASNLVIASSGGTGDADLYTRFGAAPTTTLYDCRPYLAGNNESCTVAAPQAGTYYVKLRGYSAFAGVSLKASWSTGTPPPPPGNVLQNGVPVTGLAATTGNANNYTIVVPAGASNLNLAISGGTGDADLYIKFGSAPTTTVYDCRPYKTGNVESCTVAAPQAGTYYVMVRAYSSYTGVTLKGSYTP